MGRWGSDVLALTCVLGGAVVGTGLTFALMSGASHRASERLEVVCESGVSPGVVVRLGSGSAEVQSRVIRIHSNRSCAGEPLHIDMDGLEATVDRARARAERARVQGELARVQSEQMRVRMARVREQIERPADETLKAVEEMRLQAETARLQATELQLEAIAKRLESQGAGSEAVQDALDKLRESIKAANARGGGGN